MGAAVAAKLAQLKPRARAIGLAPLVTTSALRQGVLRPDEAIELLNTGSSNRRGVVINSDYLDGAARAWAEARHSLDRIVVAGSDAYDPRKLDSQGFPEAKIDRIAGADHNFSESRTSEYLISLICEYCNKHLTSGADSDSSTRQGFLK